MELKISEEYEELAIEWQYRLVKLLKEKLAKNNVDKEIAKEIVGEFIFDMSMLHDQEEIRVNGKSYNPRISFDDFSGNLVSSDEESNLHDYASGNISSVYGE